MPNPETLEIDLSGGFSHRVLPWELMTRVVEQLAFILTGLSFGSGLLEDI